MQRISTIAALARGFVAALAMIAFGAPAAHAFGVASSFPFGPAHIGVAFTDSVDVASALRLDHYTVSALAGSPAIQLRGVALQENQRTLILSTLGALPVNASYRITVNGVKRRDGGTLDGAATADFATGAETITGIADVHANINALIGQSVTVLGQVFVRGGTVTGTPSGFIQDGTGRGLNVFGGTLPNAADSLGVVVRVTGTAQLFFTTVELVNPVIVGVARGVPDLRPRVLTVPQASSAQWEGTYIQTTATLTGSPTASGSSHYNYPAIASGTAFTFRVRNATGINPGSFGAGDVVTGAGAGSNFQGTYQATIGNAADFYRGVGPGDITPPAIVSVEGEGGASEVVVQFSEPLGVGASDVGHYRLAPTTTPAATIAVTSAVPRGSAVTLALASPLTAGTAYTLEVTGVQDGAGNTIPAGSSLGFTAAIPVPFTVSGVFQFGKDYVGVAFTKPVNASQATASASYAFTPVLTLASVALQENGQTAILHAAAPLPSGVSYSLAVSGVSSATGEPLASGGSLGFVSATEAVTNIADIQQDVAAFSGLAVTICGQVTIPVGSRGGTPSGYVQDGSGRGINLFGGSIQGAVNELGSVARVTGTVTPFFTTTEITTYTATSLASGVAHLRARRLTLAQAASPAWEGTYIEASGTLTSIAPSGTANTNYNASEGPAVLTYRVGNGLGIPSSQFAIGDRVTGRGAGEQFQGVFQISVGNLEDFGLAGSSGPDTTGPAPVAVTSADGSSQIAITFSEPLASVDATLASNYALARESDPAATIGITQASLSANGREVTLALASAVQGGVGYVATITGVSDLAGNPVLSGTAIRFVVPRAPATVARIIAPPATLMRGLAGQGERFPIEISGVLDSRAVCRVFDLQGRLVRVLFDGRLSGTPTRTFTWDGRDETFELVPAGLYICRLETTDLVGRVTDAHAPIVVAVRLE